MRPDRATGTPSASPSVHTTLVRCPESSRCRWSDPGSEPEFRDDFRFLPSSDEKTRSDRRGLVLVDGFSWGSGCPSRDGRSPYFSPRGDKEGVKKGWVRGREGTRPHDPTHLDGSKTGRGEGE